ncbi:MAG: PKD domain-containing protein [Myxococcales bacterium]|nr:PKD domain-containing protein [Myxococcales bacterium]
MSKHGLWIFFAILLIPALALGADPGLSVKIDQVNEAIAAAHAGWRAGTSPIAELPLDDFTAMLGADLNAPRDTSRVWQPDSSMTLPTHFDWRDVQGGNYVTPVKYQGRCGSCVAFGCVGAIESGIRIREQNPDLDVDLSEQQAFSCTLMSGCQMGSYASALFSTAQTQGIVDENCYPYVSGGTALDYACDESCAGTASRAFHVADYGTVWGGVEAIKQALLNYGPLTASFTVYEDLKYYIDGVYQHLVGPMLGGHQVLIVGYDDPGQYWIIKNSWSESFGEDGFFRIKWGDSGIDSDVSWVDVGTQAYQPGPLPGGDCQAAANRLYNQCSLSYEVDGLDLTGADFLTSCENNEIPQCVHTCNDVSSSCNDLAGCIGFCTDQWCAMDFDYLYDTCGLAVTLEAGSPLSKDNATALCEAVGYSSTAMKCILECIPTTNTCQQLAACMAECPLCPFPTVDFTADVTTAETAPLAVTFTRQVSYPADCGRTVSHWDFGDGTSSYSPNDVIKHVYQQEGVYSVELRVTNGAGPGIAFKQDYIILGEQPDDDTADDDAADDDDDDQADDDAADDDNDDQADDDQAAPGDDDDDDDSGGGCGG